MIKVNDMRIFAATLQLCQSASTATKQSSEAVTLQHLPLNVQSFYEILNKRQTICLPFFHLQ